MHRVIHPSALRTAASRCHAEEAPLLSRRNFDICEFISSRVYLSLSAATSTSKRAKGRGCWSSRYRSWQARQHGQASRVTPIAFSI